MLHRNRRNEFLDPFQCPSSLPSIPSRLLSIVYSIVIFFFVESVFLSQNPINTSTRLSQPPHRPHALDMYMKYDLVFKGYILGMATHVFACRAQQLLS